jgi:hypothetical protein
MDEDTDSIQAETTPASQPAQAGPNLRVLANGAVYDERQHKIVKMNPEMNPHVITKENSQIMHQKRREQTRLRLMSGMKKGLGAPTFGYAVELIGEAQAMLAADASKGRASTYAFRTLWEALGLWHTAGDDTGTQPGLTVSMTGEVANELMRMLAERAGRENG